MTSAPSVGIVGGGLAGLAAAAALCTRGYEVELFEARRWLGGRAGSFRDAATNELIDHCQHVAMGCCTNFLDLARRTGILEFFRRDEVLHFFSPSGEQFDFAPTPLLPAPLHLARSLWRMTFLTWPERKSIARTMRKLARLSPEDSDTSPTIGRWLREQGETEQALEQFWGVILISALGESLDRASLAAARKVFVDGFLSHRAASSLYVPAAPLSELYEKRLGGWLAAHGVKIHSPAAVRAVHVANRRVEAIELAEQKSRSFHYYLIATAWPQIAKLFDDDTLAELPELQHANEICGSPITSLHLWFNRPITPLPHAVLIGRLSQWLFAHGQQRLATEPGRRGYYFQVVISASHSLAERDRQEVLAEVLDDLETIFPDAREAELLRWKMLTQPDAVFSVRPGLDAVRPEQSTSLANLFLAGDWTRTGWPATMEGAVRSGYLAAEAILQASGRSERVVVPELSRSWLARWLIKS